jgi:hypothetical protein
MGVDLKRPLGWPTLDAAALRGLPGEIVSALSPHTEADHAALLFDFLVSFGNAVGLGPHVTVGGATHPAREYVVLVGRTSKARKGTSRAEMRSVMESADPEWSGNRVFGGIASGEGIIACVRDATGEEKQGVADKRLLVFEPEFARVLAVADRQGATVSHILRDAWDTGTLRVMTRRDPLVATGCDISVIAHITVEELGRTLTKTELVNGFANRYLFALADRSKILPTGGALETSDYAALGQAVRNHLEIVRRFHRIRRSTDAEELWDVLYHVIATHDGHDLYSSVMARAEAHLLRLSLIYALTNASDTIEVDHLEAAWAALTYADDSARFIFGHGAGDPIEARLLEHLRALPAGTGLDGTRQRDLFGRHATGPELERARRQLAERGLVETVTFETGGRPRIITYLCSNDKSDRDDQSRVPSLRSLRSQHESRLR